MKVILILASLTSALAFVPMGIGHGFCVHEAVHTYGGAGGAGVSLLGVSTSGGSVTVSDSETEDCNGNGFANDLDGDMDVGDGGGFFGHGPWAEDCGYHQEIAGTVTVTDFLWGSNVAFDTGADDTSGSVLDPLTGQPTCLTDGIISPSTDPDDCLTRGGVVKCPGGGDGGLWVILLTDAGAGAAGTIGVSNPPTSGTITSP